ncbi:MAG: AAA domain-containing protein [Bacteroidota bacterium]
MRNLIERLDRYIDLEYDTSIKQVKEIWKKPLAERVSEGEAISDIDVISHDLAKLRVRCRLNISKFRIGSRLRIHQNNPADGISCEVLRDDGLELELKPGYRESFSGITGSGWILDNDYVDIRRILKEVLSELEHNKEMYQRFVQKLNGDLKPLLSRQKAEQVLSEARKKGFNAKQLKAYLAAYAAQNYYLIQGPPGTGKTWVLAHLAARLAQDGERVLITAFTHRAINNALVKTARTTGFDKICKVGQTTNATDLSWNGGSVANYEKFSLSPYSHEEKGLIVGGTCFAVRTRRLSDIEFDTVIFDEAGQVTLPLAFAGMLAGKRYIFIGDHKQMPPVVVAEHRDKQITKSIFESLFAHAPGTMLDTTYRMNKEINDFPSKQFYMGNLQTAASCANNQIKLNHAPDRFKAILNPQRPSVFVDLGHEKRGMRSSEEAILSAHLVKDMIAGGINPKEIAIIAPYRAQGRLIREQIRKLENGRIWLENIVVDTVERIQGQERDVILISLTTSDPSHAANRAEFFFQPNRLNVALTRPRKKRIVIGSSKVLNTKTGDKMLDNNIEIFKEFYASCSVINVRMRQAAEA